MKAARSHVVKLVGHERFNRSGHWTLMDFDEQRETDSFIIIIIIQTVFYFFFIP